jgi:hypothetical protein
MVNEKVEKFKVEIEENNIIYLKLEDLTAKEFADLRTWADKVRRMIIALYNKTGEKVRTLVDITDIKKYDSGAYLILAELMRDNERYTLKTATFGGDDYIISAQDILLALSGRTNLRNFKTKEEAINWLISE